jgi:hypothetical protein
MLQDGPLDALAASFVLPAKSGVYLTKNELVRLARASEASLRINERRRMLADVLKSPQSLAELRALVTRLIDFCRLHVAEHEATVAAYPVAKPLLQRWVDKAQHTITSLNDILEELDLTERNPQ